MSNRAGERTTKQATRPPQEAPTWRPFVTPERLGEVTSTNVLLSARAAEGAPEGTVILAERQLSGRGRLGRRWLDHPGGSVLCSILFRPAWPLERFHLASMTVALAALDAISEVAGVGCACKWPNDLVMPGDGRKVAGILAETVPANAAVVVGIGINCNWPAVFPPGDDPAAVELARRAVSLDRVAGAEVDRDAVAREMLARVARRWPLLAPEGRRPDPAGERALVSEYRRRCDTLGSLVVVERPGQRITGTALDVDDSGRLVVDTAAGAHVVAAGDVVHLRKALAESEGREATGEDRSRGSGPGVTG